jgi:hypothetical protein
MKTCVRLGLVLSLGAALFVLGGCSQCDPGESRCGLLSSCQSLDSDAKNCGTCGNRCSPGQSCSGGRCEGTPTGGTGGGVARPPPATGGSGGGGACGNTKCSAGETCLSCGAESTCQPQGSVCCAAGTGAGGKGPVICQAGLACVHCGPDADGCLPPGTTCCKPGTGAGGSAPVFCGPKQVCQNQSCVSK